jgi:predicted ABC-type sugar transport system permease subunit
MIEGKRFPSPPRPGWTTTKMPTSFQVRIARPSLAILYLGINAVVLGFACIPPYVGADGTNRVVKGWIFAASTGGILLSSIVYYFAVIPDRSGHPWKIMWSIKR